MTKPKRRPTRQRSVGRERRAERAALMTGLSLEAYNVVTDMLKSLGVSSAEQRRALELAGSTKRRVRPSQTVLKNEMGVSLIVAMWRRDSRYTQRDGAPKVLRVRGSGITLESLVKHCAPTLPLEHAVEILLTQCEVRKIKGEKIALVGNPVNILKKTPATSLAWTIGQIRRLAGTSVFNATLPAGKKGRFERRIYGVLSDEQFDVWSQAVRPRLQETSDRVEDTLGPQDSRVLSGEDEVCGIGLFIFRDDDDLG